ncbi:MAG: TetR/AcrR family transcriptional regulator [Litorimonas sp.]
MARPRKFDEAKVKNALRDVFWQHGYDGASYADIMSATGLNKGSLYASFGDKRALYQHAISDYNRENVSPGIAMLRDNTLTPRERLNTFFTSLVNAAETREGRWGCLLCNAAIDQAPFDQDVEETVSASLARIRKAINYCVKDTPAADKADLIWTSYFGGHVMVKAGYSKAVLKKVRTQIVSLL